MDECILARQQLVVLDSATSISTFKVRAGDIDCVGIADDCSDEFLVRSSIGRHDDMFAVVHSLA